jgi:hypothetical protein
MMTKKSTSWKPSFEKLQRESISINRAEPAVLPATGPGSTLKKLEDPPTSIIDAAYTASGLTFL